MGLILHKVITMRRLPNITNLHLLGESEGKDKYQTLFAPTAQ